MSGLPIEPPDSYRALDGTVVAIPPPPPLADGPMPTFGTSDESWLNDLIAFRDRAIRNDEKSQGSIPDDTLAHSGLDPDLRREMELHFEQQRKMADVQSARFDKARIKSDALYGADGRGFLDALNDGSAIKDFWRAFNTLMYQRIPVMQYHAPDQQIILRDLLARFPERVWLPIVAQQCLPMLDHRKSDHLHELMDQFIAGSTADFRHLETGAAKPETESQLPPQIRKAVLQAAFSMLSGFAGFKRAIGPGDAISNPEEDLAQAKRVADILRKVGRERLSDDKLDLVEELFRDIQPARTYEEGQTQSEINLHVASAFNMAMQSAMPGKPEGFYLRDMLSKHPNGFAALNLATYPRQMVWPYLASHLDILDRAMGLAKPFYFEPRFERRKAIELVALLPKPPQRYGDILFEVATGADAGGRETAQRLLAGATTFATRATLCLSIRKAAIRAAAAATLQSIGDPAALSALKVQHDRERAKSAKAAMDNAIHALTAASPPDIEALLTIASNDTLPQPQKMSWIADLDPPDLKLADGRLAPAEFADWLLADASRHGAAGGAPRIDAHLSALSGPSRTELAAWTLRQWIAYDTQPWPDEKIDEAYEGEVQFSYEMYEMMWEARGHLGDNAPEYQRTSLMDKTEWRSFARDRIAKRTDAVMNTQPYLFSAQPARGVLAIARHAQGALLAHEIGAYLTAHGRRLAQAKSLLDCLAASEASESRMLLIDVSRNQKQKSLRSHATALITSHS
ncbi:MAG: hypothetical protein HKN18_08595 [Silicimonas sp.]|nr:hypothetical protein [Silicimonas sp.]